MTRLVLHPFLRYYGGKWRAAQADAYPHPLHDTIVEPFAGAAGYSLRHFDKQVILVEKYPVLAAIWRWLISADPVMVRAIPECDDVSTLPEWVPQPARDLVGFTMNAAVTSPRRVLSKGRRDLRAAGRKFEGWSVEMRERVAIQVPEIRHWKVIEGDYTKAPDVVATWFGDQPYAGEAGDEYVHGSAAIDYEALAAWYLARRGQLIVCESASAKWLPFRKLGTFRSGPTSKHYAEGIYP